MGKDYLQIQSQHSLFMVNPVKTYCNMSKALQSGLFRVQLITLPFSLNWSGQGKEKCQFQWRSTVLEIEPSSLFCKVTSSLFRMLFQEPLLSNF